VEEDNNRSPEFLEKFYREHIGLSIRFSEKGLLDMGNRAVFAVGLYVDAHDSFVGAIAMDYMVAGSCAAAMTDMPYFVVEDLVKDEEFTGKLLKQLQVFLVKCTGLFDDGTKFCRIYLYPKDLPTVLYELFAEQYENQNMYSVQQHFDLYAVVRTYGEGQLVVFDDIFNGLKSSDKSLSSVGIKDDVVNSDESGDLFEELVANDEDDLFSESKGSRLPLILAILFLVGLGTWVYLKQIKPDMDMVNLPPIIPVEFITIEGGEFQMGCNNPLKDCPNDEFQHSVKITRKYDMMISEVTQQLYEKVTGDNPSHFHRCGDDCPVENVSWLQAIIFANKLSINHRLDECYVFDENNPNQVFWPEKNNCTGWRLPTEAEWEFAARGNKDFQYSGSNDLDEVSWHKKITNFLPNSAKEEGWYGEATNYNVVEEKGKTHSVCRKLKNEFGLCDMSGNVWEWTWDRYNAGFYRRLAARKNPIGSTIGNYQVIRGGSWAFTGETHSVYHRRSLPIWGTTGMATADESGKMPIHIEQGTVGIRLVKTIPF
jgi:formylglycine-generating enzyme